MVLKRALTTLVLTAVAVALTVTTVVLAPLPLMLARRNMGRLNLLICGLVGSLALFWLVPPSILATFIGALVLTFVYCECENQNTGYSSAIFVSLLVVLGFGAFAMGVYIQHTGFDPVGFLRVQITDALGQVTFPASVKVDKEALLNQVPSAILIILILAIWMNSVLVSRFESVLGWVPLYQKHVFISQDFRKWSLPDGFVWIALLSCVGSFFDVEPLWLHWLAANVFNVTVLLYFFQGLAVIVDFFVVKRVSSLWRIVAYLFIFSQLFLMVSFLGFVDLWMSFRDKIKPNTSAVA